MGVAHLDWIGDRANRLLFQRFSPAIPELRAADNAVVSNRRIAVAFLVVDAHPKTRAACEALVRVMTRRTANAAIGGEATVEIQLAAQFDLRPRHRIFFDALNLRGSRGNALGQRNLQGLMIGWVCQPGFDLIVRQLAFTRNSGCQFRITQGDLRRLWRIRI